MIEREENDWGVRLTVKPFTYPREHAEMYIQADISLPRPRHRSEIKIYFSGTTVLRPLRSTDSIIWIEHFKAISDAARQEAARMKGKK